MHGHNGLFARLLPIALSASKASDMDGFGWRRFDLFAINQLASNRGVVISYRRSLLCCSYPTKLGFARCAGGASYAATQFAS
jgi:hypothetical protein